LTGAPECRACLGRSAGWCAQFLRHYFLPVLKPASASSQGHATDIGCPERSPRLL